MKRFFAQHVSTVLLVMGICFLACPPKPVWSETETLRMLVWPSYDSKLHEEAFIRLVREKHGIDLKLEVTHIAMNDDVFPALRDGKADIVSPSHQVPKDQRFQLIKLKLVLSLNLNNIPNYKNVIPALQNTVYFTEGSDIYGVPVARGPYGLAYNTEIVKEPPQTWNILWDPAYKGKYTLGKEQYEQNVYITALAMGMSAADMSNYAKLNTPEFQEKLAQLAAGAKTMWIGEDKPEDLKGLALAASWGSALSGLKEKGEIWKMADPKEKTTAWLDNFMISHTLESNPKLRRIAEDWLNFVLSDDYQEYLVRTVLFEPVTTTVSSRLTPEEIANFHLDDSAYFEKNRILWPVLEKTDRKGIKRLWDDAVAKRK